MHDTFQEALEGLRSTIHADPLSVLLKPVCRHVLTRIASGDVAFVNVLTFEGEGTNVDLQIRVNIRTKDHEGLFVTDIATGDMYKPVSLEFAVNYSAHGSQAPDVALRRATLISDVAKIALELKGTFGNKDYLWLHKTKAEMDELKEQQRAQELRLKLMDFVAKHSVRQVIGKMREIKELHGLPQGNHEVQLSNFRNYKVEVWSNFTVNLTRLD